MKRPILYLVPDLMRLDSGIARYGRMVCRALLDAGQTLAVIALTDGVEGARDAASEFPDLAYWPCRRSRVAFVRLAVQLTWQRRPAAILIGHPNLAPLGWMLAQRCSARSIAFIYGIDAILPLAPLRRRSLRRLDRIVSISHFTARQAVQVNGIPPEKLRILHNCLDPRFETPVEVREHRTGLSMLTVARLSLTEQYKGHDYVIRALPALLERFPQLVYHVVGDGDWRPALEALTSELNVTHAVQFHGFVTEQELCRQYSRASLFIMPSRAEGFGFVFLEAMAHGLPVIGGNLDATPEVVADGGTGYLVDPRSVEEIAAAAARLLGDDALRGRIGHAAMCHVQENFTFGKFQHTLLEHLAELALIPGIGHVGAGDARPASNGQVSS